MTTYPHDNDLGLAPNHNAHPDDRTSALDDARDEPRPTRKQLAYLRALANRSGQTFGCPRTAAQASAEIRRLKATSPSTSIERALERRDDGATREAAEDSAAIHDFEVVGHGSTCTWSQRS